MGKPQRLTAEIVILKHDGLDGDLAVQGAVDAAETVGRKLGAAREAKGLSLEEVHVGTKVKVVHLAAIESGDQSSLPAVPFAAGFVKSYAQFLGLDARAYSLAYKAEFGAAAPVAVAPQRIAKPANAEIASVNIEAPALGIEPPAAPLKFELPAVADVSAAVPEPVVEASVLSTPAQSAVAADRYVLYFSVAAAALILAAIGANNVMNKDAASATTQSGTEIAQVKPVAAPTIAESRVVAAPIEAPPVEIPAVEAPLAEPPAIAKIAPPKVKPRPTHPADRSGVPVVEIGAAPAVSGETRMTPAAGEVDPFALPVPAAHSAPATVEGAIVAAQLTRPAAPQYPNRCSARAKPVETVGLTIDITVEGRPTNAGVADSSNACFNDAAIEAAYRMRFSPRLIDGKPHMEFGKRVTVRFNR